MGSANESGMTHDETIAVIQEELRCFYVAITRARNRLVLFEPKDVFTFGSFKRAGRTLYMDDSTVMDCVSLKQLTASGEEKVI